MIIGAISYFSFCSRKEPVEPKIITVIETRWDTVRIDSIVYIPKWKEKIVYKWDTINPEPIDTAAILQDYYNKYYYEDTIKLDSIGMVLVQDTVSQNKIMYRLTVPKIAVPTKTIRITEYINENEWYLGGGLTAAQGGIQNIEGEVLFRSKHQQAFGAGVGINNQFKPSFSIKYYRKIGK